MYLTSEDVSPQRPNSSKALAALGAPPQRFSPVRAPGDSPVRTRPPRLVDLTTRGKLHSPCNLHRALLTAAHPTPPVPLSQVLNLHFEEPMYLTSEDELEH